jgi:predicted RNA-binding protein with PIN domain
MYKTTDDMLIEIAQRNENQDKNKRTIVVTSDRALAIHVSFDFLLIINILHLKSS